MVLLSLHVYIFLYFPHFHFQFLVALLAIFNMFLTLTFRFRFVYFYLVSLDSNNITASLKAYLHFTLREHRPLKALFLYEQPAGVQLLSKSHRTIYGPLRLLILA